MAALLIIILATLGIACSILLESCNLTKAFIQGHNQRRLQLTRGQVPGQPAASEMTYLTWDEELAEKAANWASNNVYMHNPDKTIPSGKFSAVGENIYIYKTNSRNYQFDPDKAMKCWWDEYIDYTYGKITKEIFQKTHKKVGHYTAMAWANTIKLGCAISQFHKDKYTCFLVVCNYAPTGNVIGHFPYPSGRPCKSMICGDPETHCEPKYGHKCSEKKTLKIINLFFEPYILRSYRNLIN